MKIKGGYIVRKIAGSVIAIPVTAEATNFEKSLRLNETGEFLWNLLEKDCTVEDLVAALLREYEVAQTQAEEDVLRFLNVLRRVGILEE